MNADVFVREKAYGALRISREKHAVYLERKNSVRQC
jgi:hypothetical protein